jgi:hypothetical protein
MSGTRTQDETDRLIGYLTWHSLADEVVCNGISAGVRHAPDRTARSMLLRQIREEYSHHTYMARLIEEHGGTLPESLPGLTAIGKVMMEIADTDWLHFLVGFQVTMDGIYGYPWSKAVMTATIRDERYFRFYDAVLFPQEIGHYDFAQRTLHRLVAEQPTLVSDIVAIARKTYPTYVEFIQTSFPYLEAVGADTSQILSRMEQIKNTYWPKEFGVAIDDETATPDSDVEYGPGM